MAERWTTSEARVAAVYFEDPAGPTPLTGLTCAAVVFHKDGTAGAPTAIVTEVGGGFYRVTLSAAPTKDLLVRVYGGTGTAGYAAQEIPVGGYVDQVDAAISSRASASALTALQTDVTTLLSRLTTTRAGLMDNLTELDAAISSRATHAEATSDSAGVTTLLTRLSATRAGLLDLLSNLDAAVSGLATHAEATADPTGVTTLLGRLTNDRAALLDLISRLDVEVSTRATHAEATADSAGTSTLLSLWTSTRASLVDNLSLLDVAVSTRSSSVALAAAVAQLLAAINDFATNPQSYGGQTL